MIWCSKSDSHKCIVYVATDSSCPHSSVVMSNKQATSSFWTKEEVLFVSVLILHRGRVVWLENTTKPGAFWMNVGAGEHGLSVCLCLYFLLYSFLSQWALPLKPQYVCMTEIMRLNFILHNFSISENFSYRHFIRKNLQDIKCFIERMLFTLMSKLWNWDGLTWDKTDQVFTMQAFEAQTLDTNGQCSTFYYWLYIFCR